MKAGELLEILNNEDKDATIYSIDIIQPTQESQGSFTLASEKIEAISGTLFVIFGKIDANEEKESE